MQTVKGCPNGVTRVTYALREKAGDTEDYNGHWAECIGEGPYREQEKEKPGQGPGAVLDYSHIWMAKRPLLVSWNPHTLKLLSLTAYVELGRNCLFI